MSPVPPACSGAPGGISQRGGRRPDRAGAVALRGGSCFRWSRSWWCSSARSAWVRNPRARGAGRDPGQADGQGAHREAAQGRGRIVDAVDSPHAFMTKWRASALKERSGIKEQLRAVVPSWPRRLSWVCRIGIKAARGPVASCSAFFATARARGRSGCGRRARSIRTRPELIRRHCDAAVSARRQRATSRSSSEYRRNWSGAAPTTW